MPKPIAIGDIVSSNTSLAVHRSAVVTEIDTVSGYATLYPLDGTRIATEKRPRRARLDRLMQPSQYTRLGNVRKFTPDR
jgi:hypothetical protein